jgi:rhombotail lipoprotein
MKTNMLNTGLLLAAAAILAGCGSMMNQNRTVRFTGSLYSYLNTNTAVTVESPAAPQMPLPLKVGVAFVPAEYSSGAVGTTSIPGEMLTGDDKLSLMQQIVGQLKPCSFVKSVEIVPTTFMAANGGFDNLDHIRNTFGVDAVLLLAYDQSQYSDEGAMALSYWTIVGAYFVKGERNETKTVMEAAFFDIGSHRLLFRPTGTSVVKGSATPVNLSEQLRLDSKRGFQEAMTNLISGLKMDLDQFGKQTAK